MLNKDYYFRYFIILIRTWWNVREGKDHRGGWVWKNDYANEMKWNERKLEYRYFNYYYRLTNYIYLFHFFNCKSHRKGEEASRAKRQWHRSQIKVLILLGLRLKGPSSHKPILHFIASVLQLKIQNNTWFTDSYAAEIQ